MADRILPTDRPFKRSSGGYDVPCCPDCGNRWRREKGGKPKAEPTPKDDCYLRALISVEMKRWIISESRRQGLSISALVRSIIRHYQASQAQGQ